MIPQTKPQLRSAFDVIEVALEAIWIVDKDIPDKMSVTNDAENVVAWLAKTYGNQKRIFYRDSLGRWDELKHEDGCFTGFKAGTDDFVPPRV